MTAASNLGGNDEREQTLNQLLTEMDGFDATKGVVILARNEPPGIPGPCADRARAVLTAACPSSCPI